MRIVNGEQGPGIRAILEEYARAQNRERFRDASFDFCYYYFRSRSKNPTEITGDLERSCLNLGFYLASFGMYQRGAALLQRSALVHDGFIRRIREFQDLWDIDVPAYDDKTAKRILAARDEIGRVYESLGVSPTETLTTKIMHGVFACVPAFDANTPRGLARMLERRSQDSVTCCLPTLLDLRKYYDSCNETIDAVPIQVLRLTPRGAAPTEMPYPVARKLRRASPPGGSTRRKSMCTTTRSSGSTAPPSRISCRLSRRS